MADLVLALNGITWPGAIVILGICAVIGIWIYKIF
jgi:hypothetical protein